VNNKPGRPSRTESTSHPLVYEVNTRVLLNELSRQSGKKVTLATLPDEVIEQWASFGFDVIWLMGVWTAGSLGRRIATDHHGLQEEYRKVLPDLTKEDILGSPYAVKAYTVSSALGGPEGLKSVRRRLARKGTGLILDFVGNHTARDHRWVSANSELFIGGKAGAEHDQPDRYFGAETVAGQRTIAFGRDPSFPGWTDTAQLNYFHPEVRNKMKKVLKKIAEQCDGVRCDMAMLMMNSVFRRTWGDEATPEGLPAPETEFWPQAIEEVRKDHAGFWFLAEAYWDMGWDLQNLGFDFTYDKRFYDRLLYEGAASVNEHLTADIAFQRKSVRFIENHDELRAASALPSPLWHCAAATVMATVPGLILFHEGQMEGRVVKLPVQLGRRPPENPSPLISCFYQKLLETLTSEVFRKGTWQLLTARPAWGENQSWQNFLSSWWDGGQAGTMFVVVNYSPLSGQCYIPLPPDPQAGQTLEFRDLMGPEVYYRDAAGVAGKGMFFDLPPYGLHIFEVKRGSQAPR